MTAPVVPAESYAEFMAGLLSSLPPNSQVRAGPEPYDRIVLQVEYGGQIRLVTYARIAQTRSPRALGESVAREIAKAGAQQYRSARDGGRSNRQTLNVMPSLGTALFRLLQALSPAEAPDGR